MELFNILLYFLGTLWQNEHPFVELNQGKLAGTVMKSRSGRSYLAFLGIPYAKPPIGNLRFNNPLPAGKWEGTLNATSFANECLQFNNETIIGDEDCLYLNVYKPVAKRNKLLPVMVWLHGGGFVGGSGNKYSAKFLLDKNIILVTVNYRLGIFGFFTTGDSSAPGNFALKDQVLALKWVQENIKAFGGDPNQVTLFGESSGGASVSLHAISKASNGLFQRYIIQSGSSLCPWAYQHSSHFKETNKKIEETAGCIFNTSQLVVNCLRRKSAKTILTSANSAFGSLSQFIPFTWTPTLEPEAVGAFLTDSPTNLIAKNKMKDLPFMSGIVTDEGLLITNTPYSDEKSYVFIRSKMRQLLAFLASYVLNLNNPQDFVSAVEAFYFNNSLNSLGKYEFLDRLTKVFSDGAFIYPELRMIEKVTPQMNNHNYLYSFGYAVSTQYNGVPHGLEVSYLFPFRPIKLEVSQLMVDLWTSFATNGKPTSNKLNPPELWKPFNVNKKIHLQIGNINNYLDPKTTLSDSFYTERMKFWQTNFPI